MPSAAKRMGNQLPEMSVLQMVEAIARSAFEAGDFETALMAAKECLPYTTPRLTPVQAIDPNAPTASEIADDLDPEIMDDDVRVLPHGARR